MAVTMLSERQTFSARLRYGKWAGLYMGPLAAFANQQIVATIVYADCPAHSAALVLGVGAACAAIGLLGALVSWRTRQALPSEHTASAALRTDRFIATLSAIFAVICMLLTVFGTPAGWILRCERV